MASRYVMNPKDHPAGTRCLVQTWGQRVWGWWVKWIVSDNNEVIVEEWSGNNRVKLRFPNDGNEVVWYDGAYIPYVVETIERPK